MTIKITHLTHSSGERLKKETRIKLGRFIKKFIEKKGYNSMVRVS